MAQEDGSNWTVMERKQLLVSYAHMLQTFGRTMLAGACFPFASNGNKLLLITKIKIVFFDKII